MNARGAQAFATFRPDARGAESADDLAILRHTEVDVRGWRKVDEVPFDFERRCVSVLADRGSQRLLVLKGAFEDVLAHSTRYEAQGSDTLLPLDETARRQIREHGLTNAHPERTLEAAARQLVEQGITSAAEYERIFSR